MMPTNISRYPPAVCIARDRRGLGRKSSAHELAGTRSRLLRQIFLKQVRVRDAIRECKHTHAGIRCDPTNGFSRNFYLRIRIGYIVDARKRAFQLVALRNVCERIMAMVPTVIGDMEKSRRDGRRPPVVAHPAATENAGAIHRFARIFRRDDKRGGMHGWLRLRMRDGEVAHDVEHASLQPGRWMRQVFEIEIGAVVEGNRCAFDRLDRVWIDQKLHNLGERNYLLAKCGEQAQILAECGVIVAEVVVTFDV